MNRVFVDGIEGSGVSPLDRGLAYGDGLFETIAVVNGRPRFLDWHLERLAAGARALGFPSPDCGQLRSEIGRAQPQARGVVKLMLTRGTGARGYRPPRNATPTRIVAVFPWPADAGERAATIGWCRTRLGRNRALAGIKHLNRLEQVLARAEWDDDSFDEGLMQDDRGQVVGATQANVFALTGGGWVTPAVDECGVAGVMRRAFREWSRARGQPVSERALSVAEVEAAQSLILTSAVIGARPVGRLAGRVLSVDPSAAEFNSWLDLQ